MEKSTQAERLGIVEFGHQLIDTQDLDPVYCALASVPWSREQMARFLLSYWCFYSTGVSSYLAEMPDEDFWVAMQLAADNQEPTPIGTRWKRAAERRHARGAAAVRMVLELQSKYESPQSFLDFVFDGKEQTCSAVMERVRQHYLFGPWIAFKIADMGERVLGMPITFENSEIFMFKDPTEAALMLWRTQLELPEGAKPKDLPAVLRKVVDWVIMECGKDRTAPPCRTRKIQLQEAETILCKWKSHKNGHYPFKNDIREIRAEVSQWAEKSVGASQFLQHFPE